MTTTTGAFALPHDEDDPGVHAPRLTRWSHVWRTALMLLISAAVWVTIDQYRMVMTIIDITLGVPAVILVFWRRRFPVLVAVVTALLSTGSALAAGPATLALVSLATRRRWVEIVPVAVVNAICARAFGLINPPYEQNSWSVEISTELAVTAGLVAWGMYLGSRRELLWTLRRRAERAEAEQELRVAQSRLGERGRIAREMHDVLAHRISQIAMHAGALGYREDLSAAEMRTSANLIQETAHQALTELRGVLGVLRDAEGGVLDAPQPTYADLAGLVAQAREHGLRVDLLDHLADAGDVVPDATGRTVFRIVQEGLTNVVKHAPGAELCIQLDGSPEDGIDVVMRNPLGFAPSGPPGSRLGLVGLTERAELRGGRLDHRVEAGDFVVRAWIPWAA